MPHIQPHIRKQKDRDKMTKPKTNTADTHTFNSHVGPQSATIKPTKQVHAWLDGHSFVDAVVVVFNAVAVHVDVGCCGSINLKKGQRCSLSV